jgi:glycerate 2-kinase
LPAMPDLLSVWTAEAHGIRKDVLLAAGAALKAANPSVLVRKNMKRQGSKLSTRGLRLDLDEYRRIIVVGGGKASGLMAVEAAKIIGDRLDGGFIIVPDYQKDLPRVGKVRFEKSTHPLPSEKGARAVRRMLRFVDGASRGDLVVVLVSGGGSALMPAPPKGVTVEDLRLTTDLLLKAGADIGETNCIRKHLSQIGGGRLAERVKGAEVLSLVISDVVGDDLSTIASGPTVPDPSTFADARKTLEERRIWTKVPASVRRAVLEGISRKAHETPKPGSRVFEKVNNLVIGSNADACAAAKVSLESRGYRVDLRMGVTGEARVVGRGLAALAASEVAIPWAAVWGGETTVSVKGKGVGGRNQEAALAAAIELRGSARVVLSFFGTDGVDGPTRAAGAVADGTTVERGMRRGLSAEEYLKDNDSHSFFKALGDLIVTGPTGTNVNDVMIAVKA